MHASMSETPNLKSHKCPYCPRTFKSLQSFGGHQTAHRREIEEMRRQAEKAPSSSAAAMHVQQNRRALDLISRVGLGEVGVARALQEEEEEEHVHVEVKREGLEELDLISKVGLGK